MANLEKMTVLHNVKTVLEIDDSLQDLMLNRLIELVCDHFKLAYNQKEIEKKFSFIIEECTIKRYVRRGAEGASSESKEGYSMSFEVFENEFKPYDEMIRQALGVGFGSKGRVVFI